MNTQTEIFRRLVQDHMGAAPVRLGPGDTVRTLIDRMGGEKATSAVIVDAAGRPAGIVTEQDVTRRIACRAEPGAPIASVMTRPVVTVDHTAYLFHAIAFMRRKGLRHIPVVDESGRVCGMLALHKALAVLSEQTMQLIDDLTHEASVYGLKKVKQAQVELAGALFEDNVPVPEVQALLTDINRDIHCRILRHALIELELEGWGPPPVPFSMIIMGSGGRGENFLSPDQDNGFVLGNYADAEHGRIDPFFIELAERMTQALDAVGIPLCRGNIMATNPVWRKTLRQWRDQVAYWMRRRSDTTLRFADIFFDFGHGFGDLDCSVELRETVTGLAVANPGFVKDMYGIQTEHKVALGWFGRLMSERDTRDREGMINLKYGGTLPLVEGVRLLALRHGVPDTSTLARIDRLTEQGVLDSDAQDYLTGGLQLITRLLLRQQIADFKAGKPVGNFVPAAGLSSREKDFLVACFRAIENLRGRLRSEFAAEVF